MSALQVVDQAAPFGLVYSYSQILTACKQMQTLHIRSFGGCASDAVQYILSAMNNLKSLGLPGCAGVPEQLLITLVCSNSKLMFLDFTNVNCVRDAVVTAVA